MAIPFKEIDESLVQRTQMVVFPNKGTRIWTPKYHTPKIMPLILGNAKP